jgi:hypothetical protein
MGDSISLDRAFQTDAEMRSRFVDNAFQTNPNISDFSEFQDAMFEAFSSGKGTNVSPFFSDDNLKTLFETPEARAKIEANVGIIEAKQIYAEEGTSFEVIREKRPSREYKHFQHLTSEPFTSAQNKFIEARLKKKQNARQIAMEYNKHFKNEQRTVRQIRSKRYELKRELAKSKIEKKSDYQLMKEESERAI